MSRDLKMPALNKVQLAGNLTRDPELKYLPSGMAVCEFAIAVTKAYSSKGERKEETFFWDCKCWKQTAEFIGEKVKKGDPVLVDGSLTQDSWVDNKTGANRMKVIINAMSVQTMAWPADGGSQGSQGHSSGGGQQGGYRPQGAQPRTQAPAPGAPPVPAPRVIEEPIPEDDIPF